MKISCQNCSSKYTVSDEKVQGKTVKLKCKKCGATILVNSGGATTVAAGAGVADHPSSPGDAGSLEGVSYLVNVAEGDQRTMTVAELVGAYQTQVVTADTYVWADGMGDWQPLGQVEAIVSALNGGTPAAPAVAPSSPPPAMTPAPAQSSAEAMASAASLAASARPAARRDAGGRRADVFGSEKNDDVATSAPLFSASARAAASNAAANAKPAQREENSVLFSLSALTSKNASTSTPAPAASRKDSREDSGLIDLRALAAAAAAPAAGPSAASSMMAHDDGGLFPLGMGNAQAPAAPPVATPVVQAPPASKAPMFIGIGALVAALAIVGVFFAMKGGEEKPPVAATDTSVVQPPPPPPVTATAATTTPTTEASATASGAPTAAASGTAVATKGGSSKGGTSKGGTGASTAGTPTKGGTGATTAAAPAGKPKGNCGCASGDLMCAMKCSAGK
jgi:predicted Zn finger-like uncharacterized protein